MSLLNADKSDLAVPEGTGRQYWRSLEQLAQSEEFQQFAHREFPEHASEMLDPIRRRTFLALMSASVAFAGYLTGCRRPVQKILPYSRRPEDALPGVHVDYATSTERGGVGYGLLVESREGRPVKLEGNPDHPTNQGKLDALTQASLLGLYDPDRSTTPLHQGKPASFDEFETFATKHFADYAATGGEGLAFLAQLTSSPSQLHQRQQLRQKFPRASWHVWELVNEDAQAAGTELVLGSPKRPLHGLESANVVASFNRDFLGATNPMMVSEARGFGRRRKPEHPAGMNRLYMVENYFSLTGAKADHRLRIDSGRITGLLFKLVAELAARDASLLAGAPEVLKLAVAEQRGRDEGKEFIVELAEEIKREGGRGLAAVMVGSDQPPVAHALAALVNLHYGRKCVSYTPLPDPSFANVGNSLAALAERIGNGHVKTLVTFCEANPVYDAPGDLNFAELYAKVPMTIHLGLDADETAQASEWHLPRAHFLESWGDTQAVSGNACITQPLIEPLYGGWTVSELMAFVAGETKRPDYDVLKQFWIRRGVGTEERWKQAIHDGVMPAPRPADPWPQPRRLDALAEVIRAHDVPAPLKDGEFELCFLPSSTLYDGRFANNGWLQETPDPVTKLTWGNALVMNVATAEGLQVENGDVVELSAGEASVELPVWVIPGCADGSLFIELGYGRTAVGRVGKSVGVDVNPLRSSKSPAVLRGGVSIARTSRKEKMACTQDHWALESDRPILRETTEAEYKANPGVVEAMTPHHPELRSLFAEREYEGQQWGMVIDLAACTGCNSCMVACQAENNIPVVGKDEVLNGREMSWIRLDRYFASENGALDEARMVLQPLGCQHCEQAPCEQVCPVAATTHSPDGLNEMTYNRCIGTRYCANNCPYKVRRFNFFNYNREITEVEKMSKNPDVTVRFRGVMEKCTYCVQRLRRAADHARLEGDRRKEHYGSFVNDGEVTTACEQTCPTEAITFGDINDPTSRVTKAKQLRRDYTVLPELNAKPRTSYLAGVANPNPEIVS